MNGFRLGSGIATIEPAAQVVRPGKVVNELRRSLCAGKTFEKVQVCDATGDAIKNKLLGSFIYLYEIDLVLNVFAICEKFGL